LHVEMMKKLFLITLIIFLLNGCTQKLEIRDQDLKVAKMKAGQIYEAPLDGWFVSNEGVEKMLKAIEYYRWMWMDCESK